MMLRGTSRRRLLALTSWLGAMHLCIHRASAHSPSPTPSGGTTCSIWDWIVTCPQDLLSRMQSAIRAVALGDIHLNGGQLVALALIYGVAHALGPGHGKFVIASYAFANAETVRRGIAVAFMTAMVQAATAVILVLASLSIVGESAESISDLSPTASAVSGTLMAFLGIYIVCVSLGHARRLWSEGEVQRSSSGERSAATTDPCSTAICVCRRPHFVEPRQIAGRWSWPAAAAVSLSIGIRPCTGAVLLMVFAHSQNMLWVGVAGVIAMALGTAATLSMLAIAAVRSRSWVLNALRPIPLPARLLLTAILLLAGSALVTVGTAVALAERPLH